MEIPDEYVSIRRSSRDIALAWGNGTFTVLIGSSVGFRRVDMYFDVCSEVNEGEGLISTTYQEVVAI